MRFFKILFLLLFLFAINIHFNVKPHIYAVKQDTHLVPYRSSIRHIFQSHSDSMTKAEILEASNEILYLIHEYNMNPEEDLAPLMCLYWQESRFNPRSENPHSSAKGFGQILMSLHGHKFKHRSDWSDVEENLYVSFMILNGSYNRGIKNPKERWIRTLSAYQGSSSAARYTLRKWEYFKQQLAI